MRRLVPVLLVIAAGCTPIQRSELVTVREAMYQSAKPAFDENISTMQAKRAEGKATDMDVQIRENSLKEFQSLVDKSRARDSQQ